MTQFPLDTRRPTGHHQPAPTDRRPHWLANFGLLDELSHPSQLFAHLTPNWYASIMGTAIIAVAAASLPVPLPGLHLLALAMWALAGGLLITLTGATVVHWLRHPSTARGHALNPVMAQFYGAPPMAMLAVGAATVLVGSGPLGQRLAVDIDWVLWFAGTLTGLASALVVPYLMFTRHHLGSDSAFGGWLMPVVPPMVSAATGALLVAHVPAGQWRLSLLLACYAMFGLSLLASIIVITLVWYRLTMHKIGEAKMVPTLWIVLGPLGQSITAANLLGGVAGQALPAPYASAMRAFGVIYGVPVWGFAVLWAGLAAAVTVRTARHGMPFSLTWWSFTFPVGTCVTGTSALALRTGSVMFAGSAALFYLGLVSAWLLVASRTAHGSARGRLFLPPERQPLAQVG